MKKLVSIFLVIAMMLSVFAVVPFSVGATETDVADTNLRNYCTWPGIPMNKLSGYSDIYWFEMPEDFEMLIFNDGNNYATNYKYPYQTYDLSFEKSNLLFTPDINDTEINFEDVMCCGGKWSEFDSSVKGDRIVYVKALPEWKNPSIYIWSELPARGDVDADNVVSVIDATAIQMHMAEIKLIDSKYLNIADYDKDGTVSVMDATEIQMILANLK